METSSVVERVIVSAQITATEHEQLQRMANVADRSFSAEIRRALPHTSSKPTRKRSTASRLRFLDRRCAAPPSRFGVSPRLRSDEGDGLRESEVERDRELRAATKADAEEQAPARDVGARPSSPSCPVRTSHRACNRAAANRLI